ncbi:hypothetical protein OZ411_04005 [Bradyrhizobium sp. Arg237L]|uniref:hypothetical protein n=1 Tax=Bradyrhizobium sp. Arg237L TaxID=3003352 RepID=UPI00249F374E|nr:hypothetical protein [Bradyrhizobium sp. Arg237L]MDI4231976.1 hypothetical protein [Bradyrhizobium sp. Arg237L]
MRGEKPAALDADVPVVRPVDDEGRDPDRRDDVADVIRWFMRAYAAAPAGLMDTRSFLLHQRLNAESFTREGANLATLPPLPQLRSI